MTHNKKDRRQQENGKGMSDRNSNIGNKQHTTQTAGANQGGQGNVNYGEGSRDRNHARQGKK
jgi:hypothetical protein